MGIFDCFKKKEEPETWRLVKIISENFDLKHQGEAIPCVFYYNLSESNKNNRKVEFSSTFKHSIDLAYVANQRELYHEKIRRWTAGRRDPDIPSYDEVDEEDTANFLKGKV